MERDMFLSRIAEELWQESLYQVNQERLGAVRELVQSGRYHVSESRIAEALLELQTPPQPSRQISQEVSSFLRRE